MKFKFQIIAISEHKFNEGSALENIENPGVKDFESTFIEIELPKKKNLIIGCIYRHPSSEISIDDFSKIYLEPTLCKISQEDKICAITGDLNVDLLKTDIHASTNNYYNTFLSNFFAPYILQPTKSISKTLIDNIFFSALEYKSNSGNILLEASDHLIQFLILEGFTKERTMPALNLYKRDFSKFNEREFEELVIKNTDWNEICKFQLNDANISFKSYYDTINYHLDEMAPFKKSYSKTISIIN